MNDRRDLPLEHLPPEVAELEAELSSLRYEERPSFGPELRAELEREWAAGLRVRRWWPVRQLLAAGVAALLLAGLGVPSARAALVRFAQVLGVVEAPQEVTPGPDQAAQVLAAPVEADAVGEGPLPASADVGSAWGRPEPADPGSLYTGPGATLPELLDRSWAEGLIRGSYPVSLQRDGVGGSVGLLLWVDSTGAVDSVSVARGSGVAGLDRAAQHVAPFLRFEPARRLGKAVPTWVRMDVRFEPAGGGR